MLKFHASIYSGRPENAGPLATTFDEAISTLQQIPRFFIEPDGSFVWTGVTASSEPWQVDGNLIDRGDALAYVEIKGRCPQEEFDQLLAAFGWPEATLAFHLPQRGITLSELDFQQLAATDSGAV